MYNIKHRYYIYLIPIWYLIYVGFINFWSIFMWFIDKNSLRYTDNCTEFIFFYNYWIKIDILPNTSEKKINNAKNNM